jgi:hypothetical protein
MTNVILSFIYILSFFFYEYIIMLLLLIICAGIRIMRFEFNELSYAPEIASMMLVRQQAEAMLDARKVVVEGAVSIAYDAVHHLREAGINVSEPEAARLASNLIVTICSESRVQPTIHL